MTVTISDIYQILGFIYSRDLVDLGSVRVDGPEVAEYLTGERCLTWLSPHGVRVTSLSCENVPLVRRVIAATLVYRVSHS